MNELENAKLGIQISFLNWSEISLDWDFDNICI